MTPYRTMHRILILLLCLLMTLSSNACRCFHRHYLYSIFYSEQTDRKSAVECNNKVRAEDVPDNQIVSLISYPSPQHTPQSSNYGEVYSTQIGCKLLIDNQVISAPYTELNDKRKCDREIIEACKALKSKQEPNWPASKSRPATYIDF